MSIGSAAGRCLFGESAVHNISKNETQQALCPSIPNKRQPTAPQTALTRSRHEGLLQGSLSRLEVISTGIRHPQQDSKHTYPWFSI